MAARLPSREDLGPQPTARTGRPIASLNGAGAIGEATAVLGNSVSRIGADMQARALAEQDFEAERKFQEFKWSEQQNLEKEMQAVEPGKADGFADNWAGGYRERAGPLFDSIPDKLKPKYEAKLFGAEREFHGHATGFARAEQKRFSVNSLDDLKNRVAMSEDLDTAKRDYDTLLKKNPYLSPIEKDQVRRKHLDDLEHQNVEWRIGRGEDLEAIIKDLDQPAKASGANSSSGGTNGGVSEGGLALIRRHEGFTPKAEWDYKQHTSGYGTKAKPGETITKEEAERRLQREAGEVSSWITQNVKAPLSQNQHDALVSFGFNLGTGAIQKLLPDINDGNFERVSERMLSFNKAGGKTLPGLVSRRQEEARMFAAGGEPMQVAQTETGSRSDATVERSDLPDVVAPSKYGNLSPQRRAALLYKARTALSATTQQALSDDVERVRRTGEPERDAEGRTVLDRAARVLQPNQLAKFRIALDEAGMEYRALTPLPEMSEVEAQQHLESLQPSEKAPQESYKSATRVLAKAQRQWKQIQDQRDKDPAQAVALSPEVRTTFERIKSRNPEVAIGQDEDGELTIVPSQAPTVSSQKAHQAVAKARLEAQARLGIPEYARKSITKREAATLLDMGDPSLLDDRQYMTKLRAASERANGAYGPEIGSKVFQDAIALQIKGKEHRETAAGIVAKMARGEKVAQSDLARLNALNDIERATAFDRTFDTREYGPHSDRSGLWLSPNLSLNQAREQKRTPSQSQIDWVRQDPIKRQALFDKEFGNGAWATYEGAKP